MNRNDLRPAGAAGNARTIVRSRRTGTMVSVSHETQAARLQRCDPCDRIYCGTAGFLAAPRLAGEDTMRSHPMTDPWLSFGRFRGCARLLGLGLFVLIVALPARAGLPVPAGNLRRTPLVAVIDKVKDSVVTLHSERTVAAPIPDETYSLQTSPNRVNGMGTGIVIDPRGYIVTNFHVIDDVQVIRARLSDGTTANARVVARDHENDLALLKIDVKHPLPTLPLGTANDLMIGESVFAVGNAYGYEHTVTTGIVS